MGLHWTPLLSHLVLLKFLSLSLLQLCAAPLCFQPLPLQLPPPLLQLLFPHLLCPFLLLQPLRLFSSYMIERKSLLATKTRPACWPSVISVWAEFRHPSFTIPNACSIIRYLITCFWQPVRVKPSQVHFTILNYTDFLGSEWHKGEKMTEFLGELSF